MAPSRILYDATYNSVFTQMVSIVLTEKQLPHDVRKLDMGSRPADFTDLYRSVLPNADSSSTTKVPVLVDGEQGVSLVESNVIVEYLEQQYPEHRLLPADAAVAARVRLFVEYVRHNFAAALFGVLRADTVSGVEAARAKLVSVLKTLDGLLRAHAAAAGPYFAGEQYSLAEAAATPVVQRAVAVLPAHRGIDFWQLLQEAGLDRLEGWLQAALARPSAQSSKPADEVTVRALAVFVADLKQ